MMNTVAPVWDGNETWLVLGGIGLVRGVSAGLQRTSSGAVRAANSDAARPDFSRRRL